MDINQGVFSFVMLLSLLLSRQRGDLRHSVCWGSNRGSLYK